MRAKMSRSSWLACLVAMSSLAAPAEATLSVGGVDPVGTLGGATTLTATPLAIDLDGGLLEVGDKVQLAIKVKNNGLVDVQGLKLHLPLVRGLRVLPGTVKVGLGLCAQIDIAGAVAAVEHSSASELVVDLAARLHANACLCVFLTAEVTGEAAVINVGGYISATGPLGLGISVGIDCDSVSVGAQPLVLTIGVDASLAIGVGVGIAVEANFKVDASVHATDLNGGVLTTGDKLLIAINVENNGSVSAKDLELRLPLVRGLRILPGSIRVAAGLCAKVDVNAGAAVEGVVSGTDLVVKLGALLDINACLCVFLEAEVTVDALVKIDLPGTIKCLGPFGIPVSTELDCDRSAPGTQILSLAIIATVTVGAPCGGCTAGTGGGGGSDGDTGGTGGSYGGTGGTGGTSGTGGTGGSYGEGGKGGTDAGGTGGAADCGAPGTGGTGGGSDAGMQHNDGGADAGVMGGQGGGGCPGACPGGCPGGCQGGGMTGGVAVSVGGTTTADEDRPERHAFAEGSGLQCNYGGVSGMAGIYSLLAAVVIAGLARRRKR